MRVTHLLHFNAKIRTNDTYPSTTMAAPVMKLAIGEARKAIQSPISSIIPNLFIGVFATMLLLYSAVLAVAKSGVSI